MFVADLHATSNSGACMGEFEFYFSFYGLLLGLSVAEVANGFLNAVGA